MAGKRGDSDINENQELIGQIIRYDLWELNIIKNEEKFQSEIYSLNFDLKVSQAYEFYKILDEDLQNHNIKDNIINNDNNDNNDNIKIESVINYFYNNL